jgi:hypothetical protein
MRLGALCPQWILRTLSASTVLASGRLAMTAATPMMWPMLIVSVAGTTFLPVSGLTVPIQPKHPSGISAPVVARGAPKAVLEVGQALVLAEAL